MPLYICGFVVLGASFQNHLSIGALVMGWGIAQVAVMVNTVAVCAFPYLIDLSWMPTHHTPADRCVRQRLLPHASGRGLRSPQPLPHLRRLQCRLLPGPLGDQERRTPDFRRRGRVCCWLVHSDSPCDPVEGTLSEGKRPSSPRACSDANNVSYRGDTRCDIVSAHRRIRCIVVTIMGS